jgi:hypothetical protein
MKKFLSLMLAMIMVMSLVTVGAGATFTDAADIQYTEAVELMAGLKILEGPGDGSFNPKGDLTRGAAAKIIAYIALGAADADEMTYDEVVFPDVPTNSATAPYIAWCAEQGIINGYKDGTFGRKNNVTGHAFLKMALTALPERTLICGSFFLLGEALALLQGRAAYMAEPAQAEARAAALLEHLKTEVQA